MDQQILSDDLKLDAHLATPDHHVEHPPSLVLCHGYPTSSIGAEGAGADMHELGTRIASSMGWQVLSFTFRGCGESEGNFSLLGWIRDIVAAADHLLTIGDAGQVWLAGFGTGGGLCINAAVELGERALGVAVLGAPAGFDDWAGHTKRLMRHSREVGVIRDADFPAEPEVWAKEFREVRPVDAAAQLGDLPMLVVHGADDESVPVFDARVLADAHGTAELRLISGAGHGLRYDPRAIAVLLGWLSRMSARYGHAPV